MVEGGGDPYESPDEAGTDGALDEFVNYWVTNEQGVERDIAHYLSGKNIGGGQARAIGGMCDYVESYCVSGVYGAWPYPNGSYISNRPDNWDLVVYTHEKGHVFGAFHTHQQNPIIDGCGLDYCDYVFPPADNPSYVDGFGGSSEVIGTIMSYCHLCPGGLRNMTFKFHPQTKLYMNFHLNNQNCEYEGVGEGAVAIADEFEFAVDETRILDVLSNDVVESCGTISIVDYEPVATSGGIIQLIPADSPSNQLGRDGLSYTPPSGFSGAETFSYTISDQFGNEDSVEVRALVGASIFFLYPDDAPSTVVEGDDLKMGLRRVGYDIDTDNVQLQMLGLGEDGSPLTLAMELESIVDGLYTFAAEVPSSVECPSLISWRVLAQSESGAQFISQEYVTAVGYQIETFESPEVETTWTVTGSISETFFGRWAVGTPDGLSDRNDPANDYDGSGRCFLTGPGTGNTDIDGGCTSLISPRFTNNNLTECTWAHWFHNGGGEDAGDVFTVEVSNDDGQNWFLVEVFGPDTDADGGWVESSFKLSDYFNSNGSLNRVKFTACDVGSGSIVEAAVDQFSTGICRIPGDLDGDERVNGQDLTLFLADWGNTEGGIGDINGDGTTNGADLTLILSYWTD